MGSRFGLVAATALVASGIAVAAFAQPTGGGSGSDDIEMEPEPTGSGSAATGSAAGSAAPDAGSGSASVKDPKLAKKWLSAGQQLLQKGDFFTRHGKPSDAKAQYDNAVTAFTKAIEAGDDVAVYYQLAIAEDKAGSEAAAYKHLKLVVAPNATVSPDVVKKAQTKLDEVATKVGLVTLVITPEGTQVSLNGEQVGEAPMAEPLVLAAGTYTLSLSAGGYQPKEVELKVEAGSESERKIDLDVIPIVIRPPEPEPTEKPPPPAEPSRLPLFVGAGATGGLIVVAAITGISAISQHSTFIAPKTSTADRKDAQSSGRTLAHVTDICLGAALGAAAFTTYWYLYRYEPQREASKVSVVPWVQSAASGVAAVGAF